VDTLRDEACPVCGETDSYDGNQCRVCGFVQPPEQFRDPDLDVAKQMDLRRDQTEPGPDNLGQFEDDVNDQDRDGFDDKTGLPIDEEEAGALDQQPVLTCPVCESEFPAGEPMTVDTRDPEAGDLGEGPAEGDVCPACGKGQLMMDDAATAEEEGDFPPDGPPNEEDIEEDGDREEDEHDPEDEEEGTFPGDEEDPESDDEDDEDEKDRPVKKNSPPFK
jgi:hypothetical protein